MRLLLIPFLKCQHIYMKFSWIANIWREREKLGWNCSGQKEPQRRAPTDGKVHLEVTTNNSHIRIDPEKHPYWWGRVALRTNVNLIWSRIFWNFLLWIYMTNKTPPQQNSNSTSSAFEKLPSVQFNVYKNSHFYSHFGWERFQQHLNRYLNKWNAHFSLFSWS